MGEGKKVFAFTSSLCFSAVCRCGEGSEAKKHNYYSVYAREEHPIFIASSMRMRSTVSG